MSRPAVCGIARRSVDMPTVGWEIFLVNHKAGSQAGIMASDAAVVASIALQYGVPPDVNRLSRQAIGPAWCGLGSACPGGRDTIMTDASAAAPVPAPGSVPPTRPVRRRARGQSDCTPEGARSSHRYCDADLSRDRPQSEQLRTGDHRYAPSAIDFNDPMD